MVKYEVRFNDGEHFADAHTLEEAREIRSKNNFKFLSRSLHIYTICNSKVKGCRLYNYPIEVKRV